MFKIIVRQASGRWVARAALRTVTARLVATRTRLGGAGIGLCSTGRAFTTRLGSGSGCSPWTLTATFATASTGRFFLADALHHFLASSTGCCGHHVAAGRLAQTTPQGLATHGDGFGAFVG
jgi:hypothetical protein